MKTAVKIFSLPLIFSMLALLPNSVVAQAQRTGALTHEAARQLAFEGASGKSNDALAILMSAAKAADREAEFGLGLYYDRLWLGVPISITPLILPIMERFDPQYSRVISKLLEIDRMRKADCDAGVSETAACKALDKEGAYRNSLHWFLLAAQHGETESQAEIGTQLWDEVLRMQAAEKVTMKMTGNLVFFSSIQQRQSYTAGLQEVCRQASQWLALSIAKPPSKSNAKAYDTLAMINTMGSNLDPRYPEIEQTALAVGCYRNNAALADSYFQKAAELGDSDAMYLRMCKFADAGNKIAASQWRLKYKQQLLDDKETEPGSNIDKCLSSIECSFETMCHPTAANRQAGE